MVQARIHQGRIQVDDPIPEAWEGRLVKIVPMTPDDPLVDLDGPLAALAELGRWNLNAENGVDRAGAGQPRSP